MSSNDDVLALLEALVAIESISGNEAKIAMYVADWLEQAGLSVQRLGRNVVARIGSDTGPTLLLNSHLDVVPVGQGWQRDPWTPQRENGRLYGRGANDAKSSVAAMCVAAVELSKLSLPAGGVCLALTCEEERGGRGGLEHILPDLGSIDAALIGEPTQLHPAVAQMGLLILELTARGKAAHAARPHLGVNAIDVALHDVAVLHNHVWQPEDDYLGAMTLQVTQIEGGTAHNVIPDAVKMVVDSRCVPAISSHEVVEQVKAMVQSEVHVRSDRLAPKSTPLEAAIVQAVLASKTDAQPFGSPTMSDWAVLGDIPGVKIGPGRSEISHIADEWVEIEQVQAAVEFYRDCALNFLRG